MKHISQTAARTSIHAFGTALLFTFACLMPAAGAEVAATSRDPGPTPGDLFQGAVIDAAPSTPAYSGFDLRDVFGGEFSVTEPGRVVLADGLGAAVQKIFFHTASPVTLSSFKLYLGSDSSGRDASNVEVALTDATFTANTVISSVNITSPYPSAVGANSIRHILVTDHFAPVTGQYFVLRLTPATPSSGIRVVEFDGVAPAGILAATHVDFSTAGFTGGAPPYATQTPVNGFTYGFYASADSTTGAFSTASMAPNYYSLDYGPYWGGSEGQATPSHEYRTMHTGGALSPSVRRYTVGSGGEPTFTGAVRVVGRFFDMDIGDTNVFIAVDADGEGTAAARTLVLPVSAGNATPGIEPVRGLQGVSFDLTTNVSPGATIDFGALALGSYNSDSTGLYAWIVSDDTAVPTHLVANALGSLNFPTSPAYQDTRGHAFAVLTNGVVSGADHASVDTSPGTGFPYNFVGLLYLENSGSGKATRFDAVRIDMTTTGEFTETPRLYLLRHNSDPASSNPAADDRYARMPVVPVRIAANSAGQPYYTFDLTGLTNAERTGYGFAVVGTGPGANGSIALSEISATAVRVADTTVITPQPFLVGPTNGHRYGLSVTRGGWEQAEAGAVVAGGHLVAINDAAESNYLGGVFGYQEVFAIGLKQGPAAIEPAQGFEWSNGDAVTYTNWYPGEPNNSGVGGADEDYVFMNHFAGAPGTWIDAANTALTGDYRGIIEVPTVGPGEQNFFIRGIPATSNIFDAGLVSPTQGGTLPPFISVAGLDGQNLTFPQVVGVINTGADVHGPDGAHTPGRSCNLTSVGGISGYLNGNNTPALVGVFLGAAQPGVAPARLDFSTSALGENFTALAPALGQVFFLGDGFTSGGIAQQFTIPAGATRLFFGVPDGNNGTLYHGTPLGWGDNSGSVSLRAVIAPSATPMFSNGDFPLTGGQLVILGGTGPYTVTIVSGDLPPGLAVSSTGLVTGTAGNGPYSFTLHVVDSLGAFSDRSFSGTIENPVPVVSGLLNWWPGENAVGEVIGGNHGSLKNGATYGAGKVGRSFSFDGVDDFALVPGSTALNLAGDLTIEGWIKHSANSAEEPTIIAKRDANNLNTAYVLYLTANGRLSFASCLSGTWTTVSAPTPLALNAWNHVAVTLIGAQIRFYVNGQLEDTVTFTATRPTIAEPVTIGASLTSINPEANPIGEFPGLIDELSLYNRALSDIEISAAHLAGAGGKARHDAARDYSTTTADGPVWSYRWLPSTALNAAYNPADANANLLPPNATNGSGIDSWGGPSSVTHNSTDAFVFYPSGGYQYDWSARQLGMGPGASSEFAVVRWKAPQAGQYAVSGTFFGTDTRPSSVDVHIFHNATQLSPADKRAVNSYRGDGVSHTQTITVAANDTVDFVLGAGGNGYSYDSSGLAASVVLLDQATVPGNPVGTAIFGWGDGTNGGIGDGTTANRFTPTPTIMTGALANKTLTSVVTGDGQSLALSTDGKLFAWGSNRRGEVGDGSGEGLRLEPVAVDMSGALSGKIVTSCAAGVQYSLALTSEGQVYSWGRNDYGELGLGDTSDHSTPQLVQGLLAGKNVVAISAGTYHAMALTSDGEIYGWGMNGDNGLLRDGTTAATRLSPVALVKTGTLLEGKTLTSVLCSNYHTVVLDSTGRLYSWGFNFHGQLGDGTTTPRFLPVAVNGALAGKTVTAISGSGYSSHLALASDGSGTLLYAWGGNDRGQLGDGTTTDRHEPVAVDMSGVLSGKTITSIHAGGFSSMVRTADGRLYCWGSNNVGQLGVGTGPAGSNVPVAVDMTGALAGRTLIASSMASYHALVITDAPPAPEITVQRSDTTELIDSVSTLDLGTSLPPGSRYHTITIRNTGTAELTGLAVTKSGANQSSFTLGSLGATTLAPNASTTFAVTFTPAASGAHNAGLHIASNDADENPFDIALMGTGIHVEGTAIYGWGTGDYAGIGDGTTTHRFTPTPTIMTGALANKTVTSVVAGVIHSLALSTDGKIFAWGYNFDGAVGDGTTTFRTEPVAVDMSGDLNGKIVTSCAASHHYSLALTSEGKVYAWGDNSIGQLGLGDTISRTTPHLVQGLLVGKTVVAISAGSSHAMALTSDGEIYGWGVNGNSGLLRDGTTTANRLSPVALVKTGTLLEGKTLTSVVCSFHRTVVLDSTGHLYSWGLNWYGQLGDGTTTDRFLPVAVNGALAGKTVTAISAGSLDITLLALTSDGLLYACGGNNRGQLGDGTTTDRHAPVAVDMSGVLSGKTITSIHSGGTNMMVRTVDGRLYCWGENTRGELGAGTSPTGSSVPVAVDMTGALAGRTLIASSMEGSHALVIAYAPPAPEITVKRSDTTELIDSVSTLDLGTALPPGSTNHTVTIRNTGTAEIIGLAVTKSGANQSEFTLGSLGATSLAPNASTTFTVTFTPAASGAHIAGMHIASNDADENPFDIALIGTGGVPITDWRQAHFTTTANSGNAADDSDPDNDGVTNLMEFATSGDPTAPSAAETPVTPPVAGFVAFTYTRNKQAMAELIYQVEWNDVLSPIGWSAVGVTETIISDNGLVQQVKALVPTGGNDQRFVHLKVTRLP